MFFINQVCYLFWKDSHNLLFRKSISFSHTKSNKPRDKLKGKAHT